MRQNSIYNILMYSHDTYGLGHIRRTMAIAANLLSPNTNILILTGSPIAGRFLFPDRVDFVRIPGMIKKTNDEYLPFSIKINPQRALKIRKNIITATAKAFQPDLFIVDKEPLGLKKEVLPTLQWMRRCCPGTQTILGLRDIMDDAETIKADWKKKGVYDILADLYSEIWVYGLRGFYNPISEYAIPDAVSEKIYFTGYIPRKVPGKAVVRNIKKEHRADPDEKLVVVTTGGGGDGYTLMDLYLSMLESKPQSVAFKSVLITGPFMPKDERKNIFERARRLNIRTYHFYRQMENMLAAADLVVCMGGYNTVCEILSQGTLALIIPREKPRREQLIRAQVLSNQNLVDYIPWQDCAPQHLRRRIFALLEHPEPYQEAIASFRLTGIESMRQRLDSYRKT